MSYCPIACFIFSNCWVTSFKSDFKSSACFFNNSFSWYKSFNRLSFSYNSSCNLLTSLSTKISEEGFEAEVALSQYIERRKTRPLFANARSIKNALDRARMRQANRIFDSRGQVLTKKELVNLEAEDILQSTVFND